MPNAISSINYYGLVKSTIIMKSYTGTVSTISPSFEDLLVIVPYLPGSATISFQVESDGGNTLGEVNVNKGGVQGIIISIAALEKKTITMDIDFNSGTRIAVQGRRTQGTGNILVRDFKFMATPTMNYISEVWAKI